MRFESGESLDSGFRWNDGLEGVSEIGAVVAAMGGCGDRAAVTVHSIPSLPLRRGEGWGPHLSVAKLWEGEGLLAVELNLKQTPHLSHIAFAIWAPFFSPINRGEDDNKNTNSPLDIIFLLCHVCSCLPLKGSRLMTVVLAGRIAGLRVLANVAKILGRCLVRPAHTMMRAPLNGQ